MRKTIVILFILSIVGYQSTTASHFSMNDTVSGLTLVESVTLNLPDDKDKEDPAVISASNSNAYPVTVSNGGKLTLVSGNSVVLKPGTKVEAGGQLLVKVQHEKSQPRLKKKNRLPHAATAASRLNIADKIVKSYWYYPVPVTESLTAANHRLSAILPVRIRLDQDQKVKWLFKSNSIELNFKHVFRPTAAAYAVNNGGWGNCPETVMVLRT